MKQLFILATLIIFSEKIHSQATQNENFSRTDFVKTSWFIDNKNGAFLKNDTLKFIKYSNKAIHDEYMEYKEYEMVHFGHGYFVELDFKRGIKMNFGERLNNYIHVYDFKEYWWQFDKENASLLIYKEDELLIKLKPIKQRKIKIKSKCARDTELIETTEVTFLRMRYTVSNASWFDNLRTVLKLNM